MSLIIAKLTLPETDNDGNVAAFAHTWLKTELLRAFGGYTIVPVSGAWIDKDGTVYEDESLRYESAFEPTGVNTARFMQIASEAGRIAAQLAVFVEIGHVAQIIDIVPAWTPDAAPTPAGGFSL